MKSNFVALGNFVQEIKQRIGTEKKTVYSVTNNRGFVPSSEVFDKQVFSADISNYKLVAHNDLAYNPSRINVGSVAICPDENGGAVSPMYIIVRCKKEILPQYLLYFLRSEKGESEINHRAEGAVRFQFKFKDLQSTPIYLPTLNEQERIVSLLDEAEQVRKLRDQASKHMKEFVPALFYKMFGDAEVNEKKWETKSLNELLSKIDSGWSPVCLERSVMENEWGVLKLGALTSCQYDDTQNKSFPKELEPRPELEVKARDVLFSRKNTHNLVAACVFVFETRPKLMLSDLTFRLCIRDENELLPEYLWQVMIQPNKRKKIQTLATGSAAQMPNISKTRLLTIDIPVPPVELQREFVQRVHEARGVQSAQARSEERIEGLYQSMLSRAFAG